MKMNLPVLAVASVVAALAATTMAAQAQNVRVRGAIESVDGNTVMVCPSADATVVSIAALVIMLPGVRSHGR